MPAASQSPLGQIVRDDAYRKQVADALDRAYQRAIDAEQGTTRQIDLASARYIVFSDQHKDARNGADDFQRCERAYNGDIVPLQIAD